jgi:hypothetical protein
MSWWVYLQDYQAKPWCDYGTPLDQWTPKYSYETEPCPEPCYPSVIVERFQDGGTQPMGGTDEAEINVTYNYGREFHQVLGADFREALSGKRASDVLALLEAGAAQLGTERSADYWEPTPGNAGAVLARLAAWARQHPDAVFRVS